ncbi:MAG: hypothetical protein NC824_00845 [Candidatus Omnitrophica bacterium]|nr:hypothetical protein [Candidatus Omnitrophota bacterium]
MHKRLKLWLVFCLLSVWINYNYLYSEEDNYEYLPPEEIVEKYLSFYATFDSNTKPKVAKGSNRVANWEIWSFEEGKKGKGIRIGEKNPTVSYYAPGNFNINEGSICFWVKPMWDLNTTDPPRRFFLDFSRFGFMLYWDHSYSPPRIIWATGSTTPEDKFSWQYSPGAVVSSWNAEEWHHIALTWVKKDNTLEKKIYLDGELKITCEQPAFNTLANESTFSLGYRQGIGTNGEGVYDEFMIWEKALHMGMIKALYQGLLDPYIEKGIEKDAKTAKNEKIFLEKKSVLEVFRGQLDKEDYIYFEDEEVHLKVPYTCYREELRNIEATYRLINYYDEIVQEIRKNLSLPLFIEFNDKVIFKPKEKGVFKVTVECRDKDKNIMVRKDLITFGVVPKNISNNKFVSDSIFGGHAWLKHISLAKKIGIKWLRILDAMQMTWWYWVEPEKGKFVWYDEEIDTLKNYGFNILGVFFLTPSWASSYPGKIEKSISDWQHMLSIGRYPPRDMEDFYQYVYETVKHYKHYIKYWEVWNEPYSTHAWAGTPYDYVKLLKTAYEAAKKADPECKVMGNISAVNLTEWGEEVLKLGGLKYMDIVSFHGYPFVEGEVPKEKLKEVVHKLRKMMIQYGGEEKPLWCTEHSINSTSFFSDLDFPELPPIEKRTKPDYRTPANRLVKMYVTFLSEGVEKCFWYTLITPPPNRSYDDYIALEYNGSMKPYGFAYSTLVYFLEGTKFKKSIEFQSPLVHCYLFEKNGKSVGVMWIDFCGEKELKIEIPVAHKDVSVYNIMGNPKKGVIRTDRDKTIFTLGEEPTYITSYTLTVEELSNRITASKIEGIEEFNRDFLAKKMKEERKESEIIPGEDFEYARRVKESQWYFINLRSVANMGFKDTVPGDGKGGWTDEGSMNDMEDMPVGKLIFLGVPFYIINPEENNGNAIITLRSLNTSPLLPNKKEIPVNQRLEKLYFLHSSAWTSGNVGKYIINYKDGEKEEILLKAGLNIEDWWKEPQPNEISRAVPIKIKKGLIEASGTPYRFLRILEWQNPKPTKEITTIEFISSEQRSIPILVAITGVKSEK